MKQSILEQIKARRKGMDPHIVKDAAPLDIPHPCKMHETEKNTNRIIYYDCPIGKGKNGERQDCPNSEICHLEKGEVVIG